MLRLKPRTRIFVWKFLFLLYWKHVCVEIVQKKNNMKANKLCKSGLVVGEWLPKKNLCFLYMTRHSRSIACHARSSSLLLQQLFVHNLFFFWAICLFIFFWVEGKSICDRCRWSFFFWKVFLYIRWSTFHDRPCRKVSFKFCIVDKRG